MVHIPTSWILDFSSFSSMFDLDTFRISALFAHLMSCGSVLWSWGVSLIFSCLSDIFGGCFKVVWWNWCIFLRNLVLGIPTNFLVGLPIVDVLPHTLKFYWLGVFLWDHIDPMVSFWYKGLQVFKRDCFGIASDVPGSFLYTPWSCCPLTKKFLWGNIPFSPMGFFFTAVFTLIM